MKTSISAIIIYLTSLAYPAPVLAQSAVNGWVIENIHGPSQVGIVDTIPVDVNKDGLIDIVSVSIDDGHLRAYINQENLEFEQQYISTDVLGAFRVSATDFNNDGEVDFLIPSIETQEIIALIYDPKATETFGYRKQIIATGVLLPTDAQAGDFNDDGLIDVVSISFEENLLLLHLQNNQGDFTTSILTESPQSPRKLVVEDFNNDQLSDFLVASSEDNSIRLFINDGAAKFTESLISDQLTGVRYIANCDLSNSGYPGFVAGVTGASQVILFSNNTNNTFSSKVIDDDLPGADSVHCADIDQDQELEIVSISRVLDVIYAQEIIGPSNKQAVASVRDGYITAKAATLENNSPAVILTQTFFENRNLIQELQSINQETAVWEDFPDGAYYVEVGDIDSDGDEDYVYAAFREDKVYWAEQTNTGFEIHTIFEGIEGPQSVQLSDIDQDGDVDVFSAGAWDDSFWFHENENGQFETHLISDSANNAARIAVADISGDGKLDVIGTSSLDDSLRWFDKNDSVFTENLINDQLDGALGLEVVDIDQDGSTDILVGSFFGNNLTLFRNDGVGNFQQELLSSNKLKPTRVIAADIDMDSDVDIIFNASHDGSVWLLENHSQSFSEILISSNDSNVNDIVLVDVEPDNDLDIISASAQQGQIRLSKNNPNLNFFSKSIHIVGFNINSIHKLSKNLAETLKITWASNVSNAIQVFTQYDLIFQSDFEPYLLN